MGNINRQSQVQAAEVKIPCEHEGCSQVSIYECGSCKKMHCNDHASLNHSKVPVELVCIDCRRCSSNKPSCTPSQGQRCCGCGQWCCYSCLNSLELYNDCFCRSTKMHYYCTKSVCHDNYRAHVCCHFNH